MMMDVTSGGSVMGEVVVMVMHNVTVTTREGYSARVVK